MTIEFLVTESENFLDVEPMGFWAPLVGHVCGLRFGRGLASFGPILGGLRCFIPSTRLMSICPRRLRPDA